MDTIAAETRPPGPKGRPLLGSVLELKRDPLGTFQRWARDYGDIVHMKLMSLDGYLVSHPDLVEQVLVTSNRNFIKPRLLKEAAEVLGNGLLTSDGDFWLRQRRLMQPAFHRDRIAGYGETMVERTLAMLGRWPDAGRFDIHDEMMRLTLGIVAETLFGVDVEEKAAEVGEALEVALQRFVDKLSVMRLFEKLPLPRNFRFRRARRQLDDIIYGVIAQRRGNADGNDLISMLLQAQDEDGGRMSDLQLRDEAITLFLAGHETTAIALSWTFYLLAQHPEVEGRLLEELSQVLRGAPPGVADMPRLRYTEMVVKESMRLYPPAWRVGREAIRECTIGGYRIPVGAQVIVSQWVLHRDPRFFHDPETFDPLRWEPERSASLPKYAYFPFAGGARRCIGDSFAMMEAILILATVMQRYHLTLLPGQKISLWPSITLRPIPGIKVEASRR